MLSHAIIDAKNPEILYATKLSSPLVLVLEVVKTFGLGPLCFSRKNKKMLYTSVMEKLQR